MSRVLQKFNNIVEIFSFNGCRLRTPNVRGEGGRLNADKEGGGSKIGKILRTSFMYDPLKSQELKMSFAKTNCAFIGSCGSLFAFLKRAM